MQHRPNPKSGTLVAAGTALTSSYVTAGSILPATGHDQTVLLVNWTKGDETSLEIKIQYSDTVDFTNAYERAVTTTDAAGLSTILDGTFTRTTTGKFMLPIANYGQFVRFQFKATAGTPTGTFGANYRLENIR